MLRVVRLVPVRAPVVLRPRDALERVPVVRRVPVERVPVLRLRVPAVRVPLDRPAEVVLRVPRAELDRVPDVRRVPEVPRIPVERVPDDRVPDDRVPDDRVADDRVPAERVPAERVRDDRVPAEPRCVPLVRVPVPDRERVVLVPAEVVRRAVEVRRGDVVRRRGERWAAFVNSGFRVSMSLPSSINRS